MLLATQSQRHDQFGSFTLKYCVTPGKSDNRPFSQPRGFYTIGVVRSGRAAARMIIPLRTDCPLRRTPYTNWLLIAANFVVFFIELANNPQAPGSSAFTAPLILDSADPHLYQFFTYQFLHAGWLHIIGNMLFLYIFGNNVNDRLGNLGYLAFYLAGGVVAGVGFSVFDGGSVLGASGAVAAVTGAYLVLLPRTNITIVYFFYLIGTAEIASLWFILFFFSQDVIGQFMPQLLGGEAVAHMAHISGTIFGVAVALLLLSAQLLPRDQFDVLAMVQRWNRRRQYRDLVSKGYDPFGHTPPPARMYGRTVVESPPVMDPRTQLIAELRGQIGQAMTNRDLALASSKYLDLMRVDGDQVLPRPTLLDIANYFASQQLYAQAAAAYEQFQRFYPNYEQIEQVHLMLGVIYARYLQQNEAAKTYLLRALARLYTPRDVELARSELAHIQTVASASEREG